MFEDKWQDDEEQRWDVWIVLCCFALAVAVGFAVALVVAGILACF